MQTMKQKITYSDEEIVQKLLSGDDSFEVYFIQTLC